MGGEYGESTVVDKRVSIAEKGLDTFYVYVRIL